MKKENPGKKEVSVGRRSFLKAAGAVGAVALARSASGAKLQALSVEANGGGPQKLDNVLSYKSDHK